jgi:peptidoglycan lytic transglycosylase
MTILRGWERIILGRWYKSPWGRWLLLVVLAAAAALGQAPTSAARAYRESPTPARLRLLRRFAAAHPNASGALVRLTLGVVAFEHQQFPAAIQYLEAARPRLPKLADYVDWYLASARAETGDYPAAARDAAAVRAAPLASPFAARSLVLQGRALAAAGSPQDAIRLLREHYAGLPQPDADLVLAGAYQAVHDLPRAAEYDQRIYCGYPASDQASSAAAALATLRDTMGVSFPELTPQQRIARANGFLAAAEYSRALAEFQAMVPQLRGPERDRAQVGIGIAEYRNGDVAAAYQYLRGLAVPDNEADAQRLFYLVECARRLNDDEELMQAVKKLNQRHAASAWRFKALLAAAGRFLVSNQRDQYLPLYEEAYRSFPDQPRAAACHWRITWDAYIHRQRKADTLLREQVERYPGHPSASAALYFLGRLAESGKDYAAARAYYTKVTKEFPNYYYGMLAHQRLAQPAIRPAGASPQAAAFLESIKFPAHRPVEAGRPDGDTTLRMARSRLLRAAGLNDLAEAELRFGIRQGRQPYLLAMEMARNAGAPHRRLRCLKTAFPDYLSLPLEQASPAFWCLLFPLPYRNDLVRSARQQHLDPYMLAALIRQESEFNPRALSPAHAYGLTQLEPGTGRALARRAGVRRFTNRSLFQPSTNLKLGARYLRALFDQWGGRWEPALASYNAGKSRVAGWLTWNDYREPAEFVESIPFTETREYVEAVLRNANVYRQLYSSRRVPAPPLGGGRSTAHRSSPRRRRRQKRY